MSQNGKGWAAVKRTGIEIEGDRLTRAPAGFDPAHRFVDDLRCKDLYTLTSVLGDETSAAVTSWTATSSAAAERPPGRVHLRKAMGLRW